MLKKKNVFRMVVFTSTITLMSLACGMSSLNTYFATETPTPTFTNTPTPTLTPSPTFTSTPTNTPTATPLPSGVTSTEQEDGSTLFVDYDNKYQIILPTGWVVIPIDQEKLVEMVDSVSDEVPELAETVDALKSLDPDTVRGVVLNKDPKFISGGFATNITIASFEDNVLSAMPLSFVTGALEQSFIDSGGKVLTQGVNIIENTHGAEIQYIDVERTLNGLKVVQRMILFQSNKKLLTITITVPSRLKDEILPVSELVGSSVKFLK